MPTASVLASRCIPILRLQERSANLVMYIKDTSAARDALPAPTNDSASARLMTCDLYILGAGISFPEHLTTQTVEILRACRHIYTTLTETTLDRLPEDIRVKCVSLRRLYKDHRPRVENYQAEVQAVVDATAIERPVAWLTPGHPRIFDSVSEALIEAGRVRGWNVCVAPAISCLDTLLAEIGYDPAGGLLIHEATLLVARDVPLVPSVATLLLQPGHFGSSLAHITSPFAGLDLTRLRDHLRRFYRPEHRCAFVRSATHPGERYRISWIKLHNLTLASPDDVADSTLFLPADRE